MSQRSARPDPALVAALKSALSLKTGAVHATLAVLPVWSPAAESALDRAARGSKRREEVRSDVLLVLGDGGHPDWAAAADAAIVACLGGEGRLPRSHVVQVSAFAPSRVRFAGPLRAIAAERDDPEWMFAVRTLANLGDTGALPVLMDHTAGVHTPFVVLWALVMLGDPIGTVVFEPNLAHPEPRTRTFALWGLAAVGYAEPVAGLVDLLDDPDDSGPGYHTPGQSMRAAQALCALFDWPFEWGKAAVEPTRARCRERFSPADLDRWRAALAAGQLSLL